MDNTNVEIGEKFLFLNEKVQVLDVNSSGLLLTHVQPDKTLSKNSFEITWAEFLEKAKPLADKG